ncbi:hypothetical protein EJB05_15900, partial [Eragrostis curvula]
MEMAPFSFDGGDADWYRSLDSFPPLCSLSVLATSFGTGSEDGNLRIAGPPRTLGNNLQGSDHHCPLLTAADSSSSAMIMRGEENYQLPMLPAPALLSAADDPFYFDGLPPMPADGAATAGLDDALLQTSFSDIDLDAFGDADDHKAPIADNMAMIEQADGYAAAAGSRNAGLDGHGGDHQKPMAVAGCYRPAASGCSFDLAVMPHVEHHHHHQASSVAALPPPMPQPHGRKSGDRSALVAAAGKTRLDHIGFDEIRKYFYMPITKAAREMNVGLTVLKKRCRELGVARWPHRKMKSLRSLILNVQEMGKGMSPAAVQRELAALETYCALMEEDPSIELTDRTKKLRQACFKESYKRRRAATINTSVIDHIYSFAHDH